MTDKNSWDIRQLQKETEELRRETRDIDARVRLIESFRDSTVEKLITVFNRLDELQEGDRWIKRVIVTALVTGVIGAIISMVVWAIQN